MRSRFRKAPSASMVVAFIALLAALGGTAVALPGSNTVTSGDIVRGAVGTSDIKNNSVRTQDIRNSTIRGRDIRNGTVGGADVGADSLTGADINESTLSVPSANTSNTSNTSNFSNFSGRASSVNGLGISGQSRTAFGDLNVVVLSAGGWEVRLDCDDDSSELELANISAGDDSHAHTGFDGTSLDLDEGEETDIVNNTTAGEQFVRTTFGAQGSDGSQITGFGNMSEDPGGALAVSDCIGSATAFGG